MRYEIRYPYYVIYRDNRSMARVNGAAAANISDRPVTWGVTSFNVIVSFNQDEL